MASFFIFTLFSCASGVCLESEIVPESMIYSTEGEVGVTHSMFCDITVEYLDSKKWSRLNHGKPYGGVFASNQRIFPWYPFLVTVKNSGSQIISLGDFTLSFGDYNVSALGKEDLKKLSRVLGVADISALTNFRLYHDFQKSFDRMDIAGESTPYSFSRILPGDRLIFVVIFEAPPARFKRFSFKAQITGEKEKKIVELPLARRVYRVNDNRLN